MDASAERVSQLGATTFDNSAGVSFLLATFGASITIANRAGITEAARDVLVMLTKPPAGFAARPSNPRAANYASLRLASILKRFQLSRALSCLRLFMVSASGISATCTSRRIQRLYRANVTDLPLTVYVDHGSLRPAIAAWTGPTHSVCLSADEILIGFLMASAALFGEIGGSPPMRGRP